MKRILLVPVLIAALALPAAAAGIESGAGPAATAEAKRAPQFKLSFRLITDSADKPIGVRGFKFKNLKMRCNRGVVYLDAKGFPPMTITDKKFGYENTQQGGTIKIKGEVTNGGKRANGRISAEGKFPKSDGAGTYKGCKGATRWETRAA